MAGLFSGTSLEQPVTCEHCSRTLDECECPRDKRGEVCLPKHQAVRVRREKRRGKWMTVAYDFNAHASDLPAMLKTLRRQFGAGGTVTADGFELQGDHREETIKYLAKLGYSVKAAGG